MLWPERECCRAFAQERIDRRFGAGRWSDADVYAARIVENVRRYVPNRLEELVGGTFGTVVSERGAFYGFVEMSTCPSCHGKSDIMLLDVRLLSLIDQTTRLLYGYIDTARHEVLTFLPLDNSARAVAKELLRYHLHRTPEQIVPASYFDNTNEPHRFMNSVGNMARTWIAIHESSHLGPGRGRPEFFSHRVRQMAVFADFFRAPLNRAAAWAEEAAADGNAFFMTHLGLFGPGRPNPEGDQGALWTSVLCAALVYALKLIETMQWSTCPPEQGIPLGRQHATARHPPTSLRYWSAIELAEQLVGTGFSQKGTWQPSAQNLSDTLDDLFRVRPDWLRREEALVFAKIESVRPRVVRS